MSPVAIPGSERVVVGFNERLYLGIPLPLENFPPWKVEEPLPGQEKRRAV